MSERVLVIASHPDDEVLGMAGTIAYHSSRGDDLRLVFLGNGVGARGEHNQSEISTRLSSAENAAQILGATVEEVHDFPDNKLDSIPLLDVVQALELTKSRLKPTLVYTHHGGDLNIDHKICYQAVLTAFRPQPTEPCSEIRCFEVNSSTEWAGTALSEAFVPNLFIDISRFEDKVIHSLRAYETEMRPFPHARSIEMVIQSKKARGGQVGVAMADAFTVVRRLIRL